MVSYLLGVVVLCAIVVPLLWAAVGARRALLPAWSGAPALTVDLVLWAALATTVPAVVGGFGWFRPIPLIAASVVVSVLVRAVVPPGPRSAPVAVASNSRAASCVAGALAGPWAVYIVQAYRYGSQSFDTLNYHLPFAARWGLTGSTWHLQNVFPGIAAPSFIVPYHPLSAEVLHAIGMLSFHRDLLSPLLNVFWLVLLGAAAWSIGAPRGRGAECFALALVAADCPLMIASQPGTAMTDLALVAVCVAAVALVVQGVPMTTVAIPLGAALGLAAGVKLNALPFVAAVFIGAVVVAASDRMSVATKTAVTGLCVGGFWYLRDFVAVGTPVPSLSSNVGAPSAHVDTFSVAHYLTHMSVLQHWFAPALRVDFGSWWPLWLAAAAVGAVWGLWRAPAGGYRVAAVAGVVALGSYLVTPTTAFGPPGQPTLFLLDVRYAMVFVTVGAVLLALASRHAMWVAALGILAILVSPVTWPLPPQPGVSWRAIGLAVSLGAIGVAWLRLRVLVLPGIAALVVALYFVRVRWIGDQYRSSTESPALAWGWNISHARIAFVGLSFNYPLSGQDLTNYVQYLGVTGPGHAFDNAPTCAVFRTMLDEGRYDYVVFADSDRTGPVPGEDAWVRDAPGAVPVLTTSSATAYRVTHPLDPAACPDAP